MQGGAHTGNSKINWRLVDGGEALLNFAKCFSKLVSFFSLKTHTHFKKKRLYIVEHVRPC